MGRFRALLIGIAQYRDPAIRDLSFIPSGVGAVGAALESRGYVIEDGSKPDGEMTGTELVLKISVFLSEAQSDDNLLIFLSGHGVHAKGVDYLVPSDASLSYHAFTRLCVALTEWNSDLESTQAASVVFFIDACREGFDEQVMAVDRTKWSTSKGLKVASRKVAFVFACPPGMVARYVQDARGSGSGSGSDGEDGGTGSGNTGDSASDAAADRDDAGGTGTGPEEFSLFGRAVAQLAADPDGPSTLAEVNQALLDAMRQIAVVNNKPVQQSRVRTESDLDTFVVLPRDSTSGQRESWREAVADHPAWDCVPAAGSIVAPRSLADQLAARLAAAYRQTAGPAARDPWRDTALGPRISERSCFLLSKVLGNPELSPADAALLATVPFVYTAYWAQESARLAAVDPADLEPRLGADGDRAAFERFARGYPRLLRRAQSAPPETGAAAEIGWWIFHRWLLRRPESYCADRLDPLLQPVRAQSQLAAEIWDPARTIELLRSLGADPAFLSRTDRKEGLRPSRPVASGTKDDQSVRERLIGYILAVAHRLAIEPGLLPGIVAEHLGISDPVSVPGLLRTVAAARWEPRGQGRVLSAACEHPAVEVALRDYVGDLDALLGDAHRQAVTAADLELLAKLPAEAAADDVGPQETARGRAYTDAGVRFRLDDDRVQQLLMGEQLYGDRALAVRELYQNALDACRYRQARTEYLRRTGSGSPELPGAISFTQGTEEDGRRYIQCTDTGIGMGVRELSEVFAQAGARFADLPEFLEEQAEWAQLSPPVELFPNSRFGIGVLSYFMLADEIMVSTCRLGRDGRPGRNLRVFIAGPGSLFRIVDEGDGELPGTTVRLYLRADQADISCADALRGVLAVAEFPTRAVDTAGNSYYWNAGELVAAAVAEHAGSGQEVAVVAAPPVWWVSDGGAILADGIVTDRTLAGAVVSLNGRFSPQLSVDRRRIIGGRPAAVEALLEQAVPALLSDPQGIATWKWLCALAEDAPRAADLLTAQASAAGTAWTFGNKSHSARRAGCFPPDDILFSSDPFVEPPAPPTNFSVPAQGLPDPVAAWRASAFGDGSSPAPVPALPSDAILLSRALGQGAAWLDPAWPVPAGHLIAAALKLRRPVQQVAGRLAELGYQVPDVSALPSELALEDLFLVDRRFDAADSYQIGTTWLVESPTWVVPNGLRERDYLQQDELVPLGHLIGAAVGLRRTAAEVAERLSALGYQVPDTSGFPADLVEADFYLLFDSPGGAMVLPQFQDIEYLRQDEPVPPGHIIRCSLQYGLTAERVAGRLRDFGYRVPDVSALPGDLSWDDVELAVGVVDRSPVWLAAEVPVPVRHVLREAAVREVSAAAVAGRLTALGFVVPDLSGLSPDPLTHGDTALLDEVVGGRGTGQGPLPPVPASTLRRAAVKQGRDPGEVRDRLAALGFPVPGAVEPLDPGHGYAELIGWTTTYPPRTEPTWLDPAEPVSLYLILSSAVRTGSPPRQVADRFLQLGYQVPAVPEGPGDLSRDDLHLAVEAEEPSGDGLHISLRGLIRAVAASGRPAGEVAGRLSLLGYAVPAPDGLPGDLSREDIALVTIGSQSSPGLDPAAEVPLGQVLRCAELIDRDAGYVADRLEQLGYRRPDPSGLRSDDLPLIRSDPTWTAPGRGANGWLDQFTPVRVVHIAKAALASGRPATEIARRLRYLGFTVPDIESLMARGRPGPGVPPVQ